ncbi:putative uncharacterized protein [Brachyspira sp. CAG:700]|nr:putative uncharacterized protein [Brachyspira sp. CAG:700]
MFRNHIFKFDFLNDDFSKLPKELKKVIDEKPEKLIIYINPPYAEATSGNTRAGTGKNKSLVARGNKISEDYKDILGKANNEIFAQFFIRIYKEIPNCIFATFSTLKYLNSTNFIRFREYFKAKFLKGFIVPAYTFDNVKGKFPIGFLIWDTSKKEKIENITVDIYDITNEPDNNGQLPIVSKSQKNMQETNGSQRKNTQGVTTPCYIGRKSFYGDLSQSINKWIKGHDNKNAMQIVGYMENPTPDFQNNSFLCIINKHGTRHNNYYAFSPSNFFIGCIYFYVRHCIPHNWINNNDQFLYPNDNWEKDLEFQSDCLSFTLFHGHNRISAEEGINHWIPFSEAEVEAKNNFESHFMKDFIDGKIKPKETKEPNNNGQLPIVSSHGNEHARGYNPLLLEANSFIPTKPIKFSKEAKDIFEAGRELWKYYHKHDLININASYYDIRKFFQGVDSKSGRMNNKSIDETYNKLIGNLRERMKILAKKIEPKIYEFGFLKK